MNALPDADQYLPDQTEADRATDYPYDAPQGAFVLDHGRLRQLDDPDILAGRTAVLSVGSNRAPVQLRRKFGDAAIVPVTPAVLHDCDIVHNAAISYYGAVSCTAFPSKGTDVLLNVAWLDAAQLAIMHRTEAIGVAYDFIRFFSGVVTHLPALAAGGDVVPSSQPIFGYASRSGAIDAGGGQPASLARIGARGRRFSTLTQQNMARIIHARSMVGADQTVDAFIETMVADRDARMALNRRLAEDGLHADGPWQVQPVDEKEIDSYL